MLKKTLAIAAIGLAAVTLTPAANAGPRHHGGHHHGGGGHFRPGFGFYLGAPLYPRSFYYPYYDPFYYPYYPPVVTVPVEPPVYIERERSVQQPQPLPEGYWYFCSDPEGYYPYVSQCPGGWRQVDPIPPQ